jgi:hypothetical protein
MDWIQTFTGRKFHSLGPTPEQFHVEDIAHSLSLLCRFNGHCLTFYSVAEHSVRVARILPPGLALWGLLHDAGEAYLTDLPRPVKQSLPQFSELEDRVLRQVAVRFGLSWPMPPEVKLADTRLLATEARDLMAPWPDDWRLDVEPLPDRIVPLTWQDAERLFLAEFTRLTIR